MPDKLKSGQHVTRCFTGLWFDKDGAESIEGREALSATALKHRVPCAESLADVAAYCNDRKLASRHVKDGCDYLYMWALLKKKEVIFSEARVLGLGPRFMSIYIQNLASKFSSECMRKESISYAWDIIQMLASKGVDDSLKKSRKTFRRTVISWAQLIGSSFCSITSNSFDKKQLPRNCKLPEKSESWDRFLLSKVLVLRESC